MLDVVKASTGELQARVPAPPSLQHLLIENKGGILVLADKTLMRLRAEDDFDPSAGTKKELSERPLAVSLKAQNLNCSMQKHSNLSQAM